MFIIPANLAGLTLYPTPDGRWQAAVTFDRVGWRVEIDDDPVKALDRALDTSAAEPDLGLEDLF